MSGYKEALKDIIKTHSLYQQKVNVRKLRKPGTTKEKRNQEIIISLTSFPGRISFAYETLVTLLHQDLLADRVILWLAKEEFVNQEKDVPQKILDLQSYGLEIRWCTNIKAYKKLVPALRTFPNALLVTVDDDWYYRSDFLKVLVEEHEKYPNEIICHAITHPVMNKDGELRTNPNPQDYRGTSSYFHKLLGGSGVLFPPGAFDNEVLNEPIFMDIAPTNDDIWFWGMAVKHGTKTRLAEHAQGLIGMTDAEAQNGCALSNENENASLYEVTTNRLLRTYPDIKKNLMDELNGSSGVEAEKMD